MSLIVTSTLEGDRSAKKRSLHSCVSLSHTSFGPCRSQISVTRFHQIPDTLGYETSMGHLIFLDVFLLPNNTNKFAEIALPTSELAAQQQACGVYRRAAGAARPRRAELLRRLASATNELAVRYMNDAQRE